MLNVSDILRKGCVLAIGRVVYLGLYNMYCEGSYFLQHSNFPKPTSFLPVHGSQRNPKWLAIHERIYDSD
jgi:hypothetical protein